MKLLRLHATGFRGLPDGAYDFCQVGADAAREVTIATGSAGAGKTSLLEAIIAAKEDVGAYGPMRALNLDGRSRGGSARLDATWLLSPAEKQMARVSSAVVSTVSVFGADAPPVSAHPEELRGVFREHSQARRRAKVEYFHASRALPPTRGTFPPLPGDDADARVRLISSNEKYRMLRRHVVEAIQADERALAEAVREHGVVLSTGQFQVRQQLREVLKPFLLDKVFDGIEPEGGSFRLRFVHRDGTAFDIEELSAGEQQGVLFALTFHRLGLDHSIVLIDEPELHIHASRRAAFLQGLWGLGRDNQLIVATGSTELVAAAAPGQVLDLSRAAMRKLRATG